VTADTSSETGSLYRHPAIISGMFEQTRETVMTISSTKTLFGAALVAGIALFANVDGAHAAGGCFKWICGDNGTLLSGIQVQGLKPVVSTVILPSGETVEMPGRAADQTPRLQVANKKKQTSSGGSTKGKGKDLESNDRQDNFSIQSYQR
jgi:hypothetical protein